MGRRERQRDWPVRAVEWLASRPPLQLLVAVLLLVPLGTLGYALLGDLTLGEGLYQTITTLTTVGYADLVHTAAGRVFGLIFMGVGVAVFVMALSVLAATVIEGRLREVVGRRRMEREVSELREHVILCGFGRFGQLAADHLQRSGVDFVLLDSDSAKVTLAEERGLLVLHLDATEESSLRRAGIARARGLISTLASDASNVYVALTAKQIRPDVLVVTMARDASAESKLRAAGADYVVSPYTIGAQNMARRILQPHLSEFLDGVRGVKVRLEELAIRTGSPLAHQRLKDTPLRRRYGVTVVAVVRTRAQGVEYNPPPELELEAGDVLVVVGSPEGLEQAARECQTSVQAGGEGAPGGPPGTISP